MSRLCHPFRNWHRFDQKRFDTPPPVPAQSGIANPQHEVVEFPSYYGSDGIELYSWPPKPASGIKKP